MLKTIMVAAAICRDGNRILAAQRGYGAFRGFWEFPGGKLEAGETPEQALERELREEMDISISVGSFFMQVEYDYPDFHLSMCCYDCRITAGRPVLKEHMGMSWLTPDELEELPWLPADQAVIDALVNGRQL